MICYEYDLGGGAVKWLITQDETIDPNTLWEQYAKKLGTPDDHPWRHVKPRYSQKGNSFLLMAIERGSMYNL